MRGILASPVLVLALCFAPCAALAQERMEPGLWETQTASDGGNGPGQWIVATRCIDATMAGTARGSADDIRKAILAEGLDCKIQDVTAEAERVTFRQTCGALEQTAEFFYRGTTMEGRVTMSNAGNPPMTLVQRGKRIGPCP
ncbi:DUF3617 domain-containing protein [Xanthobacter sediminis]|uniref:DUF3617 domain-containing protein n=1 Tax=Xanthobacter sediminis TaxID=3119926 RepID=UPI003729BC66